MTCSALYYALHVSATPGVTSVIPAKRSTYEYYLPNTVTKVYSQTSVIQKESFLAVNPADDLNGVSNQKAAQQAMVGLDAND